MSDEKIDLAEFARQVAYEKAYAGDSEFMDNVLALVAAVRAARAYYGLAASSQAGEERGWGTLMSALNSFTDSAEPK